MLRYLSLMFEDEFDIQTSFILFKSDFSESDKRDFSKAASLFLDIKQFESNIENNQDFEEIWKWFFHRHIVETIVERNLTVFEENDAWKQYKNHVLALKLEDEKSGLKSLIPKIKKGMVELNVVGNKLGFDFEFADESNAKA